MARGRIKCAQCGAKNGPTDLCRICGTLLPGAEKRRREGTGGAPFDETVSREREAWTEYNEGRMSVAARTRRPESLPDAPPATWGVATALLDGAPPAEGEAAPAAPPPPPPVPRAPVEKVKAGRGLMVVLGIVAVAAVAVGAMAYLRQTDPAAKDDRNALLAALPVLAGPGGRFAQEDVTSFAKSRAGLEVSSGPFGDCAGIDSFVGSHGTAGASARNVDGSAGFALDAVMLDGVASAHELLGMAATSIGDCAAKVAQSSVAGLGGAATTDAAPEATAPVGDETSATKLVLTAPIGSMRFDVLVMRAGRTVVVMVATTATPDGAALDPAVLTATLQGIADKLQTRP